MSKILYHASNFLFSPGDIVDPAFSKKGKVYATTDKEFALFAASERYKTRKMLSDGLELAPDPVPIYLFEVEPVDPEEDTFSLDDREHTHCSYIGFTVIREVPQ